MEDRPELVEVHTRMLLSESLQPHDREWAERLCWLFYDYPDLSIKKLSVVCLGHIARICCDLSSYSVGRLHDIKHDPEVVAEAENALEDYVIFAQRQVL